MCPLIICTTDTENINEYNIKFKFEYYNQLLSILRYGLINCNVYYNNNIIALAAKATSCKHHSKFA